MKREKKLICWKVRGKINQHDSFPELFPKLADRNLHISTSSSHEKLHKSVEISDEAVDLISLSKYMAENIILWIFVEIYGKSSDENGGKVFYWFKL